MQKTWPDSSQVEQKVQQQSRQQPPKQQQPPRQQNNPYAKPMLRKCFKYREPRYRSNVCRSKNLNLVEVEVREAEMNDVGDEDDEEALELKAYEGELLKLYCAKKFIGVEI